MLRIEELTVRFGAETVLDRVTLELAAGASLAVVGESGAGKTTLGLAVARLTDGRLQGRILWGETDLLTLHPEEFRRLRWNEIALVLQHGGDNLHPGLTIEQQVTEPMIEHDRHKPAAARERARRLLREVGLAPEKHRAFPHTLSGGEKQQALIAMALANDPKLIILDEPTSGLDTVTRRDILTLLHGLSGRCALLLLTHDLAAASALAGRTVVLYRGQVMEEGPSGKVLRRPRHPYTRGLLRAYPNMTTTKDLQGIPGRAHRTHGGHGGLHPHTHDYTHHPHLHGTHRHGPEADPGTGDDRSRHSGCPFHPRCTQAVAPCPTARPPLAGEENGHRLACHRGGIVPLLQVRGISKRYGAVRTLEQVTLTLYEGETLAVVGQSGSGKTTLANVIMGLTAPEAGEVWLEQEKVARRDRDFYRRVQMVFQDPAGSISHRHTVLQAVAEPLLLHLGGSLQDHTETVHRVLEEVQLPSDDLFLQRYPHHMSGGENQRVAIARALTLGPKLLVADEPTSALDASIQAKIFRLLLQLQEERGLALLLITHDLALARKVCDRLVVLQAGRVIETGPSDQITTSPVHPHTRTLVAAAPAFCSGCEKNKAHRK